MPSTERFLFDPRSSYVCIESNHALSDYHAHVKIAPAKRIMSLKEPKMKMSKSDADPRSRIRINDSTYDLATKVRLAVTDSLAGVTYQPEERPGVSNLLAIMSSLDDPGRSCEELADLHHEKSMRKFKDEVIRTTDRALAGIRERYNHLLGDAQDEYLNETARDGAVKAREMAENTMSTVRRVVGLT